MPGAAAEMLFRRGWLPVHPHAVVVLVHGFGEHSGRYEHVGRWLAQRGMAVHAYDHLGHGRSTGPRAHVDRFDAYLDDLALVLDCARAETPRLPVFLLGHSMGGLVVASFARERAPQVSGIALSAPALALPASATRFRRFLARQLRRFWPTRTVPSGIDAHGLSRDPRVVEAYLADPLVVRQLSVSLATELFDRIERTGPGGADIALPLLVLHGDADPICPPPASWAFAEAAPRGRCLRYPGMRHEIFNEPGHEQGPLSDLRAWVEEQLETRVAIWSAG